VLHCAARRLRCPFSAAGTGRTGRRLIGEFWPGGGLLGSPIRPGILISEGFLARFPRNFGNLGILGGDLLPILATVGTLNGRV
jgi:hypothetical protein